MVCGAGVSYSSCSMNALASSATPETVTTWEFTQNGRVLACQHTENARGTHTIVVTENGAVIERHVINYDPAHPTESARQLQDVRQALRGIYQRRFPQASGNRLK